MSLSEPPPSAGPGSADPERGAPESADLAGRFRDVLAPLSARARADRVGTLGSAMHEGLDPDEEFVTTMVRLRQGEVSRADLLAAWRLGG